MKVTIVFTKIDIGAVPSADRERLCSAARKALTKALGVPYVDIELCGGSAASEGIAVYISAPDAMSDMRTMKRIPALKWRLMPILSDIHTSAGADSINEGNVYVSLGGEVEYAAAPSAVRDNGEGGEYDYAGRALMFTPSQPRFSFERVILPERVRKAIDEAIIPAQLSELIFDKWGLSEIASPTVALCFYGQPGTGKTMAAEAVAHKLGCGIIRAAYADIESKYHGEGPKMVKALFRAASEQNAVLFIDEAESLLSRRLSNVTQGSEQAINSMRSQLLISLEEYKGVVIFATNLIDGVDKAFLSRLCCIEFPLPDKAERQRIWEVHLYPHNNRLNLPLGDDIDTASLAERFEMCGRDVREVVKLACIRAAVSERKAIDQGLLMDCAADVIGAKPE